MSIILGIDIGGTKSAAALADEQGNLIGREQIETKGTPEAVLEALAGQAQALLRAHKLSTEAIKGIGVSCGGPLDRKRGIIQTPPNLPAWKEIKVKEFFEKRFKKETLVENDANATALAEHRLGAGVGYKHVAFLTMGTGIGAGLILDGQLYAGADDLAGEVGHTTILIDGPVCGCGKRGCLEALASGPSIARTAKEALSNHPESALAEIEIERLTAREIIRAAQNGDNFAKQILDQAGFYMGVGLANLLQTLNLELIVLGTLAVHAGDLLLEPIRDSMRRHSWPTIYKDVQVVPAGLGDRAQDYAAISLWLG